MVFMYQGQAEQHHDARITEVHAQPYEETFETGETILWSWKAYEKNYV